MSSPDAATGVPRTLRGDIWLFGGQGPVSLTGFPHGGARSHTRQLVPRQHHLQEFPGCWRPCTTAFFPSGQPCWGDKAKGCTVWVQDIEMQPLVLQKSINCMWCSEKKLQRLGVRVNVLPATSVPKEQSVWWAYTVGGTVTFHVTHTVITEEHVNHVNVCIRNTLILLQLIQFSSVSHVWFFATPWTAARQASLSITNSWSLFKFMTIKSVMPSNHLILCHPLLLPPSVFPSIRVFSNESALPIRWLKYWSFSFNISPSNEHSGLISFRMDWLDLLTLIVKLRYG